MKSQEGPFAFPQSNDNDSMHNDYNGMMLRDYFAAKAMQSLINKTEIYGQGSDVVAKNAYFYADRMIEERNK